MSHPKSKRQRKGRSKNGTGSRKATQDPVLALLVMARLLNDLERHHPKLKHGIIFTDIGYVLEIKDKWVARPLKGGKW